LHKQYEPEQKYIRRADMTSYYRNQRGYETL